MEDSKELIIKYFFIEHLKVKEIAEKSKEKEEDEEFE